MNSFGHFGLVSIIHSLQKFCKQKNKGGTIMGKNRMTEDSYKRVADDAKTFGSAATAKGEQRKREGKGLHPMVDPQGNGVIRRSISRFVPDGDVLILASGVAMLKETRFDTTSSMGTSLDHAFEALPRSYKLLADGEDAVLGRYDTQIITSMFNDVGDDYVLLRSHAEMDEKIAEQMTLMVPERAGGDFPEDPQYGIFGAAYLTAAAINRYGLKTYDFTVSDATGRDYIAEDVLIRVFGKDVFKKVTENGYQLKNKSEISTHDAVQDLLKRSHAFFLQVENESATTKFWTNLYGKERVVKLPSTKLLPEVEAAIIGLTEGVLSLQTLEGFLIKNADVSKENAALIKRAVAGIPIGEQMSLPNFDKIPVKGSIFKSKDDLWPIEASVKKTSATKGKMW